MLLHAHATTNEPKQTADKTQNTTPDRDHFTNIRGPLPRPWLLGKTVGGGGGAEGGDISMEDMNLAQWSLGTRLVIMELLN